MNTRLHLLNHPVLQHKLGHLRDKETEAFEFRRLMNEIGELLAYEATRDWPTTEVPVETPIAHAKVRRITEIPYVVSIMRAGNGMLDGILRVLPFAKAGHIGIYRDKFIQNTVEYYFKIPESSKGKRILLCDPLLATADTAIACLDRLKQYQVGPITMLCVLVSKEGIERLLHFHPDIHVYALNLETEMNDHGYLVPGLGDAGDRLFGTK